MLPAGLWFVEWLLDEDELGAGDVVLGSDAADEAPELCDTVESAALDTNGAADEVVDDAVDAAKAC